MKLLKTLKHICIVSVLVLACAGCSFMNKNDTFVPAKITFDKYPVISVNAAKIEVVNNYEMPMEEPHVEHLFPVSLQTTMTNLIDSKILGMGQATNKLRVLIDEMSVIKEPLDIDKSLWGKFKKQPNEVLKSRIVMRFEMVDANDPDVILGHTTLVAKRNRTLMEGLSVAGREKEYYELTNSLVDDVTKGFQETVKRYFGLDGF